MKLNKMLAALMTGAMIASGLVGCRSSNGSSNELRVVNNKTVELGETVSLDPSEYLAEPVSDSVLRDITVESVLKDGFQYSYNDMNKTVTSTGKDYLDKGTYEVTLKYKDKSYPVRLIVQDTVMPEFVSPAAVVTVPVGNEDFDFENVYRVRDKDEVTLTINGDYDLSEEGTYPVTLVATDASGNTNTLEITINVVGKNQQIKASDQFDNEMPADSDSEQDEESTTDNPDDPIINQNPDQNNGNSGVNACTVSNTPVGTTVYYSFSDLYNAGTAWNKQNSNNYFFYLEGKDDCGNKVYFLTTGSSSGNDTPITTDPVQGGEQAQDLQ